MENKQQNKIKWTNGNRAVAAQVSNGMVLWVVGLDWSNPSTLSLLVPTISVVTSSLFGPKVLLLLLLPPSSSPRRTLLVLVVVVVAVVVLEAWRIVWGSLGRGGRGSPETVAWLWAWFLGLVAGCPEGGSPESVPWLWAWLSSSLVGGSRGPD